LFSFCSYQVIPENFVWTASLLCVFHLPHSVCFCYYWLKVVLGFIPYSFSFLCYCCMWDKVCSLYQILYCFPLGVCKLCSSPLHSSTCLPVVKFMSAGFLTHWQNTLVHLLLLQAMFFLLFIVLH
jgi:hypothetical protein